MILKWELMADYEYAVLQGLERPAERGLFDDSGFWMKIHTDETKLRSEKDNYVVFKNMSRGCTILFGLLAQRRTMQCSCNLQNAQNHPDISMREYARIQRTPPVPPSAWDRCAQRLDIDDS